MKNILTSIRDKRSILFFCITLMAIFLFFGGPGTTSPPIYPAIWNLGHILFFGLLTVWIRLTFPPLRPNPGLGKLVVFSLTVLVAGLFIEWAQYGLNRTPDWHDIWRNLVGAWLGWGLVSPQTKLVKAALALVYLFILLELAIIARVGILDRKIQRQLPVICTLEDEAEEKFWTGDVGISKDVAADGSASLKVQLGTTMYSGTSLKHFPGDWRDYFLLKFDVFNPEQEDLKLTLRINDKIHDLNGQQYSDRFNTRLIVGPGWNHIEIPLEKIKTAPENREIDMEKVSGLAIFATQLGRKRAIYLDYFRLN